MHDAVSTECDMGTAHSIVGQPLSQQDTPIRPALLDAYTGRLLVAYFLLRKKRKLLPSVWSSSSNAKVWPRSCDVHVEPLQHLVIEAELINAANRMPFQVNALCVGACGERLPLA